jgi:FkbM family methyltransferase
MCCGAGEDISFDIALNAKWGMRVICVDPTPRAIHHVESLLLAHGQGRQMAIDGGPDAYEMSGFRREDFMLIQRAIWSSDGVIDLYAPRNAEFVSFSALNLQQTDKRIQVPASRISTILNERGETQLALLKLDIEGAEYEVLRSMLASGIFPAQLLVEFDQVNQPLSPLFWVDLLHTSRELKRAGYQLVHRERANYLFVLRAALES